ncbi:uncharacterized protein [Epargyreus clarus]|uniref:uncharacterized protein n=1 Tax=Epargyreus clarus TaxID=520877 RepID=UPI003C2DD16D
MSAANLEKFLKALDSLKQDYTCGACGELCKDPVTLSTCFHMICAAHFGTLKSCPTCSIPLEGCKTFRDDRLQPCVDSAKELDNMFSAFRTSNVLQDKTDNAKRTKVPKLDSTEPNDKENKNVSTRSNKKKPERTGKHDSTITSIGSVKALEKRNTKGETALHIACRLGKIDRVTELLNQGANTNTKDNAGWTPLHEAVQNGRLDLVTLLLQFNTLVNVPGLNNETPLHEAIRNKHKDIIVELVRNGADVNARNSKGETPIMLASEELKAVIDEAADNVIQTQGVNVTMISELKNELDFDDIHIYCVSTSRTVHSKLKLLCKQHSNVNIEAKFTKKVTHLVVDTDDDRICTSSLDVLQGIVYGNWILSSQWVSQSTDEILQPFKEYEVIGIGSKDRCGPKNARYNTYMQLPGIFNGCHFYLHNFGTKYEISKSLVVSKPILNKLITDAGGIVLRRVPNPELIPDTEKLVPYHAKKGGKLEICSHYIIFKDMYEPMYNMRHFKALPIGWLIDCIEKYELCEP